jgi:hypothetical protein
MTTSQVVRITGVIVFLVAFLSFLAWPKLGFILGAVIFLLVLLGFVIWWREEIIEPDNGRMKMAINGFRCLQEGTASRSRDGNELRSGNAR